MIQGTQQELDFWKGFVKTERFLNGWVAKRKTPELNEFVAHFIQQHDHAKILDCGSGVVSILNGLCDDAELVATDLLAEQYAKIFQIIFYLMKLNAFFKYFPKWRKLNFQRIQLFILFFGLRK